MYFSITVPKKTHLNADRKKKASQLEWNLFTFYKSNFPNQYILTAILLIISPHNQAPYFEIMNGMMRDIGFHFSPGWSPITAYKYLSVFLNNNFITKNRQTGIINVLY